MNNYHKELLKNNKHIILLIAMIAMTMLIIGGACANDDTIDVPEALPEDTPSVVEDTPVAEPEPAPEPEPEIEPPSNWQRVDVFGVISVEVSKDWTRVDEGDRIRYFFDENSEMPAFAFYTDYVRGFSGDTDEGFDEFFDWWLAERFNDPGISVISQDFVKYNGIRGLEIVFDDSSEGETISRHSLYSIIETTYLALTFRFEQGGEAPYLDDVKHVLGSMLMNNVELNEWPALYLPKDTPKFTGGGDIEANAWHSGAHIYISDSSKEDLSEYFGSLKNSGWDMYSIDPDGGMGEGSKEPWSFIGFMQDDGTTVMMNFSNNDSY